MIDKDIPTLKSCGVPFGARVVFRMQWLPFTVMCLLLLLTLPFVLVVYLFSPEAGHTFLEEVSGALEWRLAQILAHRQRVIALYSLKQNGDASAS